MQKSDGEERIAVSVFSELLSPDVLNLMLNTQNSMLREKKRERERDDLWRKMQDLSLKNAAKEGISLGTGID